MDLFKIFTDLVDRYGVDPKRVKLEITESVFLVDPTNRLDLFYRLQEYGFLIELDDFGSGYSSLNMLSQMTLDILQAINTVTIFWCLALIAYIFSKESKEKEK